MVPANQSKWPRSIVFMLILLKYLSNYVSPVIGVQNHGQCQNATKCDALENTSCLGVTLPYKQTKIGLFADGHLTTEQEVKRFLGKWKVLQSVPRCWTSLQSFLCTLYLPKCDNDLVYLPSYEMCKTARNNCKFIEMYFSADKIPFFLNCSQNYIKPNCGNGYQDLKFNSSSAKCKYPLTPTEDSNIWYPGFDGCGLQCENPLISEKDQAALSNFIWWGGVLSLIFVIVCFWNFRIEWKSANRYPSVVIFYINISLIFHNLGWMVQFLITKQAIVCRPDNTRRYGEPSTSGRTSCLIVFFLTYYFPIAALIWLAILSFLWDTKFRKPNGFNDFIARRARLFHLAAWSIPLFLFMTIFGLSQIDSSPMLGICYVGFDKPIIRIYFVFVPMILATSFSVFYLGRSINALIFAKSVKGSQLTKSRKGNSAINKMLLKLVAFLLYIVLAVVSTIFSHFYEYNSSKEWKEALDRRIICSLNLVPTFDPDKAIDCESNAGLGLFHVYFQLCIVFGSGIAVSLWSFTSPAFAAWRRYILKRCDAHSNGPLRARKHEIVAKAYKSLNAGSEIPSRYPIESIHGDPVDMNLTSATSQDISSEWANSLRKFIYRRGAVTKFSTGSHYLQPYRNHNNNNNSSISDISQQRFSFSSFISNNRRSLDSQISNEVGMVDLARQVRKTKKERRRLSGKPRYSLFPRRGSDSSTQSINLAVMNSLLRSHDGVTRATSTGDLQQQLPSIPPVCNFMPSSFQLPAAPFPHPSAYPIMSPTVPIMSKQRASKPPSNHPFTHGMSQQSDSLINPLQEKRRPDSRITGPLSPSSPEPMRPLDGNLGVGFLNSFNYQVSMMGQPMNPYINSNLVVNGCAPNGLPNYFGFTAPTPFSQPTSPSIYNPYYQCVPCPPYSANAVCNNLEELQKINREREACLPLITGVDSASENEGILPIHISDSEGFTDGGIGVHHSQARATQQLVDARIQRVQASQAQAEAEANGIQGINKKS